MYVCTHIASLSIVITVNNDIIKLKVKIILWFAVSVALVARRKLRKPGKVSSSNEVDTEMKVVGDGDSALFKNEHVGDMYVRALLSHMLMNSCMYMTTVIAQA